MTVCFCDISIDSRNDAARDNQFENLPTIEPFTLFIIKVSSAQVVKYGRILSIDHVHIIILGISQFGMLSVVFIFYFFSTSHSNTLHLTVKVSTSIASITRTSSSIQLANFPIFETAKSCIFLLTCPYFASQICLFSVGFCFNSGYVRSQGCY